MIVNKNFYFHIKSEIFQKSFEKFSYIKTIDGYFRLFIFFRARFMMFSPIQAILNCPFYSPYLNPVTSASIITT